jgi:hypothetical protein
VSSEISLRENMPVIELMASSPLTLSLFSPSAWTLLARMVAISFC